MYIQRAPMKFIDQSALADELERLLTTEVMFRRPCAHCSKKCDQCGSLNCLCNCSSDCAEIPRALSSDPDNYPLEPGTVPLVFEMSRLREISPCWSCEGHLDPEGKLWKIPQVWFYASSPVYASLLSQYVWQLHSQGQLVYPWQVTLLAYGEIGSITYSLMPDLNSVEAPLLHSMQYDMKRIASDLVGQMMLLALKQRDSQINHQQ